MHITICIKNLLYIVNQRAYIDNKYSNNRILECKYRVKLLKIFNLSIVIAYLFLFYDIL